MRILYDASLAGIGHRNGSISGLIRTAENLLFALLKNGTAEITLCSSLSYEIWRYSRQYLTVNESTTHLNFVRDSLFRNNRFEKLQQTIFPANSSQANLSISNRLLKRAFGMNFRPFRKKDLIGQDIYHSPYHALPKLLRQVAHIQPVLTVHDIIPMIHPEYFGLPRNYRSKHFDKEYNLLESLKSLDNETWIHCPSLSTRNDLCNFLGKQIDPKKIAVVPWAASPQFYPCRDPRKFATIRKQYQIPEGQYILSLSTLEPRKNIVQVIRSFAQLLAQENLPDFYLVLAGAKGWQYQPIFQELSKFDGLQERIIFTGYVADDDLATLYSNARVFVYPSHYEGFGLPPLEAMQCGTPVITANTSSLPEVVGDAGILLPPDDLNGLSENILKICTTQSLYQRLSEKSKLRAAQFSWEKCAEDTYAAYRLALKH